MNSVNVLVPFPTFRSAFMIKSLPQAKSSCYRFIFHDQTYSSLLKFLEDAKAIVSQKNIDIVLSTGDVGALLKAALVQEFPHLRGPSVESVFLAYNKYYTRCFLDPQPIPFASLDLTATNLDQVCEEALKIVGTPAFFKPTTCCGSMGISTINNSQQLKKLACSYTKSNIFNLECSDARYMNSFYSKNIGEQKYSLASKPSAIIEEYVEGATLVNTSGYVFNGRGYHWSMSDDVHSKRKPFCSFGGFVPSSLPVNTQEKIWALHDQIVAKMIEYGFNNDFVNVETFLCKSGEVKLVEVNPRRSAYLLASGEVFNHGNAISAELKLATGINPGPPMQNGRCAMHGYIKTRGSGKAKEFYDYSYTESGLIPEHHPESLIDGSGECGSTVGRTCLSGDSFEEVMEKYWTVCRRVLLKPELSIWN